MQYQYKYRMCYTVKYSFPVHKQTGQFACQNSWGKADTSVIPPITFINKDNNVFTLFVG